MLHLRCEGDKFMTFRVLYVHPAGTGTQKEHVHIL